MLCSKWTCPSRLLLEGIHHVVDHPPKHHEAHGAVERGLRHFYTWCSSQFAYPGMEGDDTICLPKHRQPRLPKWWSSTCRPCRAVSPNSSCPTPESHPKRRNSNTHLCESNPTPPSVLHRFHVHFTVCLLAYANRSLIVLPGRSPWQPSNGPKKTARDRPMPSPNA